MFEQTFKNIDDILHKDAGCGSELDYVEQTSWILFLKYLDDLERDRATASELTGKTYTPIIDKEYQWNTWAAPKITNGGGALKIDHNALTGDDLTDFVNNKLFPYLKKFKLSAESADTIEYKIGEIFSELKNRIQSGYNLREVINRIDELRFRTHAEKHEMSHLYEDKIKNMGNAGRNGGEYYTPRPLINTIVKVVAPKIGDKIYDGAVGSAGFLCEALDYLKNRPSTGSGNGALCPALVPSGINHGVQVAHILNTPFGIGPLLGRGTDRLQHRKGLLHIGVGYLFHSNSVGIGKEETPIVKRFVGLQSHVTKEHLPIPDAVFRHLSNLVRYRALALSATHEWSQDLQVVRKPLRVDTECQNNSLKYRFLEIRPIHQYQYLAKVRPLLPNQKERACSHQSPFEGLVFLCSK